MDRNVIAATAVALIAIVASGCAEKAPEGTSTPPPATSSASAAPASLVGPEWAVVEIAQEPVVANSTVTITFGADGRVSGNSTCNGFSASYTNIGDSLRLGPTLGTLRACEDPAMMAQETRFLGLLAEVRAFSVTDSGLVLRTADGRTITARRG